MIPQDIFAGLFPEWFGSKNEAAAEYAAKHIKPWLEVNRNKFADQPRRSSLAHAVAKEALRLKHEYVKLSEAV